MTFAFGLLHGLGFVSALSFTDDMSWALLSSLLAFNVGIEIGQVMVMLLAAPAVLLVRRLAWSRFAHLGATGVIAAFGFFWFSERLLDV